MPEEYKEIEKNSFADLIMEKSPNLPVFEEFIRSQNGEDFFNNHLSKDYDTCPKGSKISKAFKHFVSSKEDIDFYQIKYSQIIQQSKITGALCVSVHPLDFLSLSENNYNWRTCVSLNGDYSVSTLNYMLDPSTIILYVKGTDNSPPGIFPIQWNNKKWRMLMYFSIPNNCNCKFLVTGRQYPFSMNKFVSTEIYNYLFDITGDFWNNFRYVYEKQSLHDQKTRYVQIDEYKQFPLSSFIDQQNRLMYNDVLLSNRYTPFYSFSGDRPSFPGQIRVEVGADVPCIKCGQPLQDIPTQSGDFMCFNCWEHLKDTCAMCNQTIPTIEIGTYYDDDVNMICQSCWNRAKHKKGIRKWL